jgi:glycosyltransferase involved in cell wall biosynthesis
MKRKIALYDPYLDTLGGGERHILSILQVLEACDSEISIFWDQDLSGAIADRLNIKFKNKLVFLPNIFKSNASFIDRANTLGKFDVFFYVTDGSYFFSRAKNNFVFSMVPDKKLYRSSLLNKLKLHNYRFIANSVFTHDFLRKNSLYSKIIYPYIDNNLIDMDINSAVKDKVILTVGRFFKHLHSKRQDIAINLFKKLRQNNPLLKDFKLILAGGLKDEDKDYFEELKTLAGNDHDIIFQPNIFYNELLGLYKRSLIYWHMAGYGIDDSLHPESVEHLGITPLEAMAAGCVTLCYQAGGIKEIIKSGENGYLFTDEKELEKQMTDVLTNSSSCQNLVYRAKKYIRDNFSYPVFSERVKKVILDDLV